MYSFGDSKVIGVNAIFGLLDPGVEMGDEFPVDPVVESPAPEDLTVLIYVASLTPDLPAQLVKKSNRSVDLFSSQFI